jgi:effector-binding domain-containing protein
MIEEPQVVRSTAQRVAKIHLVVPKERIREVMMPGLIELRAALTAQGVTPIGPWFTHHLHRPADTFDYEICLPVDVEISPAGRVEPGTLVARTVAHTIHHGSYDGLGAGWGELMAWIGAKGLKPAEDLWEVYAVGPESSADPAAWRTELNCPLAD